MKKLYNDFFRLAKTNGNWKYLLLLIIFAVATPALAQVRTISGTVTDEKNESLPGVTVSAKSGGSTLTDVEGKFTIRVSGPAEVLRITMLSFVEQTITVGNNTNIAVTLQPDLKQLKDVVVIGYGTSSKKDLTGSITTVKADEFNVGVITTPAQLLQGKVAGLNVTKSGDPNQQPTVLLRGPSTLRTGAQTPFYVIDGVPGANIDILAPADIESIDVAKDASATAIYGSRAANGVIFVTTRRSKVGQNRLTYSAYAATEAVSKHIDMLSGNELRDYLKSNGQTLVPLLNDDGSNTNWQDLALRRSYSQNHNLSYGGATSNAEFGVSVNYLKNNGILKNTSLERTILKGYINQRFFDNHLKLNLTLTNSQSKNNDVPQAQILPGILFYLPTVSPFNADGTYKENYGRTGSGTLNPLSLIDNNFTKTERNLSLINGSVQVDILRGLKFTVNGSLQREQSNVNQYFNSASGLAVNFGGRASRNSNVDKNTVVEGFFNYDREFGSHSIKLLAGHSYQQNRINDGFGVATQTFSNDNLTYFNLSLSNPTSLSQVPFGTSTISTLRILSYYGRAQYQYKKRYLFQASLREDGSSAFGVNNRWGLFPAVSGAWQIIEEDFMKKLTAVSDLKLRVGYGVSGNSEGFNAFTSILVFGNNSKFLYNGNITNALGPVRNDAANLKWESTATTNFGLDFGFLKDRITGSVDYYIKKTSDLIANYNVSTTQYYFNTIDANVGDIKNSGIELVLNAKAVSGKNFKWSTSINLAHNKNVVEKLSNEIYTLNFLQTSQLGGKGQSGNYSQIIQPGSPIGTFNLWHYLGKNEKGVSTYQKADGSVTAAQPLTTDQMVAGNAQPKLVYGFSNTFNYKNFDLNFLVRGVLGNKILNATLANLNNPVDSKIQNIPRFTLGESYNDINGYLISDRFLESGSYLRLDNATLGYSIKPKVKSIKNIRLYVSGNNLFVITKYKGIDPEINIGGDTPGVDNNNFYPKTRTFIFGVNASF
ncbi:TonB-dependent receptor [Mucilaginibacter galii]|uniref:SusC/RagA family TonB-linked outer membrane protein n=1 Tax=Mucilaginibacter galii TaxID=2005073 RepID=A0A917JA60_9SPHI|nr:TonB-dependent receptor [Mucilaginibacter galii]GGI51925.1 SusC/RagA family TonB-linked outer membrane protein [Mucilaginibacter galii]